jgi:crotonobetainyl-CoA:carnitine CoA-transferase CaiB-like acyl-CoA transferase
MSSDHRAARPLSGITVVEFGHSVAAPFAGSILADLGARVVKIENPQGGDYARGWGPPFWKDDASAFHALNRGKESVAADFADPEQADRLRRFILEEADVVLQNLRAGVLDRFGLGPDELRALKPTLIWCDIGAFGATGPLSQKPGYDPLMQASSGIMSITGHGDDDPVRVGVSIVDMGSGMWAVIGILTALMQRAKDGQGTRVETSLYETGLAWMTIPLAGYAAAGDIRKPHGSGVGEIVPYQAFRTRTGWLMVAAGNDNLFRRLCKALDRPDLAEDARYRTNADRVVNRTGLIPAIADSVTPWTAEDLAAALDRHGVPNAPIYKVDQVYAAPQTHALGLIAPGDEDDLPLASIPIALDGQRPRTRRRAPKLGEHNAALDCGHRLGSE